MGRLKLYMFILFLLVSLLGLAVSFPSFFLSIVIQPITLALWAMLRILNSVDQTIYWIILIAVCSILVLQLMPSDSGRGIKGAYQYTYRADDRVSYWQTLITNDVLGDEEAKDLRDGLQKLIIAALPPVERSGPINWDEVAASGKTPLSPEARRFLFPSEGSARALSRDPRGKFIRLTPRWMRKWVGTFPPDYMAVIAEILAWIETEMKISHDQK